MMASFFLGLIFKGKKVNLAILGHGIYTGRKYNIIFEHNGAAAYSNQKVQVDTIHHDAVTQQVWVVDQAAYDEQVITGYRCSCGATK